MVQQSSRMPIFCCYAREDTGLLKELEKHLKSLERQNMIQVYHDGDISAGKEWDEEIKKHLNEAKIILLLISSDFIASEYCYSTEMQRALERHKQREARVISIILRPTTDWKKNPREEDIQLGQLQALPKDGKPITSWTDRDEAWKNVTEEIAKVVTELTETQPNRQKQIALDKVEKLVPGVDISFYQDKFGNPIFKNHKSFFINPNDEKRKFIEYIFVDEYFYLDAVADTEGKVLYFALTIRDKSFNPIFRNQVFQVKLGISKYSDIPGEPHAAQGCFGANWFAYYETKYYGRPGAYEDFGFGFNTAGYLPTSGVKAYRGLRDASHNCNGTLSDQEIASMKDLIADEVFNTYAVSAPGIQITDYAHIILGVNYDQVRILNP